MRMHMYYVFHVSECAICMCHVSHVLCNRVTGAVANNSGTSSNERTNERTALCFWEIYICCEKCVLRERHFQRNFTDNAIPRHDTPRGNISDRKYFFASRPDRWKERDSGRTMRETTLARVIPNAMCIGFCKDFILSSKSFWNLLSLFSEKDLFLSKKCSTKKSDILSSVIQ